MTGLEVAEGFAKLLQRHNGFAWMRPADPPWWTAQMNALREMPGDFLRILWDLYDGCNAPLGFAGETIHAVLNERGDGAYCAV